MGSDSFFSTNKFIDDNAARFNRQLVKHTKEILIMVCPRAEPVDEAVKATLDFVQDNNIYKLFYATKIPCFEVLYQNIFVYYAKTFYEAKEFSACLASMVSFNAELGDNDFKFAVFNPVNRCISIYLLEYTKLILEGLGTLYHIGHVSLELQAQDKKIKAQKRKEALARLKAIGHDCEKCRDKTNCEVYLALPSTVWGKGLY